MSDVDATVRMLLAEAGLPASEAEIAALVAAYPEFRAGVESLYAVEDARYASPALHFDAEPTFADWASEEEG
jgi:hypothetical protein